MGTHPAQVAFVAIKDSDGWETTIRSVDGRPAPAGARKIALLPGKHSIFIDVVISQSGSGVTSRATGYKTIDLDAVAGRSYVIDKGNVR